MERNQFFFVLGFVMATIVRHTAKTASVGNATVTVEPATGIYETSRIVPENEVELASTEPEMNTKDRVNGTFNTAESYAANTFAEHTMAETVTYNGTVETLSVETLTYDSTVETSPGKIQLDRTSGIRTFVSNAAAFDTVGSLIAIYFSTVITFVGTGF